MSNPQGPVMASDAPVKVKESNYPEPFASRMAGRRRYPVGDHFGVKNFGVNRTVLAPGALTALHHRHSRQDEFIFVLSGEPLLVFGSEAIQLAAGMCVGFPAGGEAHHVENRTDAEAVILEVGDRAVDDEATYPDDDIAAIWDPVGRWRFQHKNGEPY